MARPACRARSLQSGPATWRAALRRLGTGLVAALSLSLLAACGGSGSGSGGTITPTPPPAVKNTATIVVDGGPTGAINANVPYVTVTLCAHGSTTNCQTLSHVLLDTGSVGFRVLSEALTVTGLTPATDASGNKIIECGQFADGYVWGQVTTVDLTVGGLTASNLPIQVIGEQTYAGWVPPSCSNNLPAENSVATFGANGVLGIGPFPQDCGVQCTGNAPLTGFYYSCTAAGSCAPAAVSTAAQVLNPVSLFPSDNNGIAIQLPPESAPGTATAKGTLFFGIGTETNNALPAGTKLYALDDTGAFTTTFNGTDYTASFLDSGSNAYFFDDSAIATCTNTKYPGFYCGGATQALSATITGQGANANSVQINFIIDDTSQLLPYNYAVLPSLGGPAGANLPNAFDWGLPFYYGKTTFQAFQSATVSGVSAAGPWVGWVASGS